uniref:Uncharacterized protein n=1 Tax=Lepeophtheirus salmonis TaxID=72036 RepID=A0A0K2VAT2_LEPSM
METNYEFSIFSFSVPDLNVSVLWGGIQFKFR